MINLSPDCKKTQIAKATKAREKQGMKATRHEMHKSMLDLKYLKQVRDEEHRSTQSLRHEQPENTQDTRREVQEPLREKCPNTEFFLVRIFPHSD